MIRWLLRLAWCAALLAAGQGHTQSDEWAACCFLNIVQPASASPGDIIIDWQRETAFTGTGWPGEPVEGRSYKSYKRRRIDEGLSDYLSKRPRGHAKDYFEELGMSCAEMGAGKARCLVEVPIGITCRTLIPGDLIPLPKALRGEFPAVLHVIVNTSLTAYIDSASRVLPIQDGHLCHRF